MRIGARTLKSGIAILISLVLPGLIGIPEATTMAGLSSVAAMQQSVKRSYDKLLSRILANFIGGVVAVAAAYFFGTSYFVVAVSAIVLIAILHQFDLDDSISLAAITLVVIMLNDSENIFITAVIRVAGVLIGVTVSFLVNQFILPPEYDEVLFKKMVFQTDEVAKLLRSALRKNTQYSKVASDLKALEANEKQMDKLFLYIKDEVSFSKRFTNQNNETYPKARILVVYRQFLRTNKAGLNLVRIFHNAEYLFNHFPDSLRVNIRERLETLITAHEQIILKFSGRISAGAVNFHEYKQDLRLELMDSFFKLANNEKYMQDNQYDDSNGILYLMAAIFEYEEQVHHLNTLVRNYRTFHQETIEEVGEEVNLN